jgi:cell division protein FtsB
VTADYASLEARVADLEQQMRHIIPAKIDAVSYGLSLVHEDTRYLREQSDIHGAALERQETRLDRHGELLGSLADRLARQGETLDRQGETLERHGETLERHGEMLERQGETLERHGEMLEAILRRLPEESG